MKKVLILAIIATLLTGCAKTDRPDIIRTESNTEIEAPSFITE